MSQLLTVKDLSSFLYLNTKNLYELITNANNSDLSEYKSIFHIKFLKKIKKFLVFNKKENFIFTKFYIGSFTGQNSNF